MRHNTLAKIWGVFFVCFCSIFGTKKNTPHFVLDRFCTGLGPAPNKSFSSFNYILRAPSGPLLTLLGPQSRFGDKLLIIRVPCPHIWECGAKGVKSFSRPFYVPSQSILSQLSSHFFKFLLSLLELQSHFGNKPLRFQLILSPKRDCGPKRVKPLPSPSRVYFSPHTTEKNFPH